jgi:hypothetical protein
MPQGGERIQTYNLKAYAEEIRLVAKLKAQGITPLTLEEKNPQAAAELGFVIGQLDDVV